MEFLYETKEDAQSIQTDEERKGVLKIDRSVKNAVR